MKITREEQQTLADRLAEVLALPTYDPATMVTIQDLAQAMDTTEAIAERALKRSAAAGKMEKIQVRMPSGKRQYAYKEKENP